MVFVKGKSGNPGGRVSVYRRELLQRLKDEGCLDQSVAVIRECLNRKNKPAVETSRWIIEQFIGRPPQAMLDLNNTEPLIVKFVVPRQGLFKDAPYDDEDCTECKTKNQKKS